MALERRRGRRDPVPCGGRVRRRRGQSDEILHRIRLQPRKLAGRGEQPQAATQESCPKEGRTNTPHECQPWEHRCRRLQRRSFDSRGAGAARRRVRLRGFRSGKSRSVPQRHRQHTPRALSQRRCRPTPSHGFHDKDTSHGDKGRLPEGASGAGRADPSAGDRGEEDDARDLHGGEQRGGHPSVLEVVHLALLLASRIIFSIWSSSVRLTSRVVSRWLTASVRLPSKRRPTKCSPALRVTASAWTRAR